MFSRTLFRCRKLAAFLLFGFVFLTRYRGKPRLQYPVKRILVCNPAHIGDVILSTAVLPLLKEKFPEVKIGFLCGSWSQVVVRGHPDVDFVHIYDHKKYHRGGDHKKDFFQNAVNEISSLQYDLSLDLYHDPDCTKVAARAKIPCRIGYGRKWCGFLLTHAFFWREKMQSRVQYHLELLEKLGIQEKKAYPHLRVKHSPTISEKTILFHIGAGSPKREWDVQKWKTLSHLCVEAGYHLIFTGRGERERNQILEITHGLTHFTNLCDQLSFDEWVSLIAKVPLIVNVNTSAGHVAACFQRPNIVIFAGIDHQLQWGPLNPHAKLLMKKMPCYPCYKGCALMPCIQEVTSEEVFAEIEVVLGADASQRER